jgi:hypothetical protein
MKHLLASILLLASGASFAGEVCMPDGPCVTVTTGTVTGPNVPPPPPTPPSQPASPPPK